MQQRNLTWCHKSHQVFNESVKWNNLVTMHATCQSQKKPKCESAVLFIGSDTCLHWFCTCIVLMFQILVSVIENYPITCWCKDQAFWSIIFWIALFFAIYRNNQTLLSIAMTQNPLARIVFLWHTVKTLQLYMSSGIATQGWQKCSLAYIP